MQPRFWVPWETCRHSRLIGQRISSISRWSIFFCARISRPTTSEEDIGAEIIGFLGSACYNRIVAEWLITTPLALMVADIVTQKQRDDDMVLQAMFTLYRLFQHDEARNFLLKRTQLVPVLMNLIYDSNHAIKEISSDILDLIKEFDAELANRLLGKKFQTFNPDWVSACNAEEADGEFLQGGMKETAEETNARIQAVMKNVAQKKKGVDNDEARSPKGPIAAPRNDGSKSPNVVTTPAAMPKSDSEMTVGGGPD